jgi:hypothetical protein
VPRFLKTADRERAVRFLRAVAVERGREVQDGS